MGIKDSFRRASLVGIAIAAVNVSTFDKENVPSERVIKTEQKLSHDYSWLVDEGRCATSADVAYLRKLISIMGQTPTGQKLLNNLEKRNVLIYSEIPGKGKENVTGGYSFESNVIVLHNNHFGRLSENLNTLFHEAEHARHRNDLYDKGIGMDSFQSLDDTATFNALMEASANMIGVKGCIEVKELVIPNLDISKEPYVMNALHALQQGKTNEEAYKTAFFARLNDVDMNNVYLGQVVSFEPSKKKSKLKFDLNPDWNHISSLITDGDIHEVPENPHQLKGNGVLNLFLNARKGDFSSVNTEALMRSGEAFKGAATFLNLLERSLKASGADAVFLKGKNSRISPEEFRLLCQDIRKCRMSIVKEVSSSEKSFGRIHEDYVPLHQKINSLSFNDGGQIFTIFYSLNEYMEVFKTKKVISPPMTKDEVLPQNDPLRKSSSISKFSMSKGRG